MIQITPDVGLPINVAFSSENPKLMEFDDSILVEFESAERNKYKTTRELIITTDLGDGEKQYILPRSFLVKALKAGRRYLMIVNDNEQIFEFDLI